MKFISIFTLLLATFVSPGWASELRLACKGSSYDFSVDGNPRPPHTLNIYALNGVVSLSDTFFSTYQGNPVRYKIFEESDATIKFRFIPEKTNSFYVGELDRYTGELLMHELKGNGVKRDGKYIYGVGKHYRGECSTTSKKF